MNEKDLMCRMLFQRSNPPYVWEFRDLDHEVFAEGERATRMAINRYTENIERHGIGKPPAGDGRKIVKIEPYHVPRRNYD